MHQPYTCVVKGKPQNYIPPRSNIYGIFKQRCLGVDMLCFLGGGLDFEWVVCATEIPLAGANDVKSIPVLFQVSL